MSVDLMEGYRRERREYRDLQRLVPILIRRLGGKVTFKRSEFETQMLQDPPLLWRSDDFKYDTMTLEIAED